MADPDEDVVIHQLNLLHVTVVLVLQTFQLFIQPLFLFLKVALLKLQLPYAEAVLIQLNAQLFIVLLQFLDALTSCSLLFLHLFQLRFQTIHFPGEPLSVLLQCD